MPPAEAPLRLIPRPPSVQGRVTSAERWASRTQFGDMTASTLSAIIAEAKRGNVSRWVQFCQYAIETDEHLTSLSSSRYTRVVQADWIIKPNEFGDPAMARLAAEFVNEQLARIGRYQRSMRSLLSAIGTGFAVGEMVWARDSSRTNYVERIVNREAARFRYDEQWNLRLYDGGARVSPGSIYGEALDPRLMIVHEHQEVNGYPGASGVMLSCAYGWLFARWTEKFNILFLEKFGSPIVYAKVDPDSKENVRNQILEDLQNLSNEHVGVIEGHEITLIDSATRSGDGYQAYLTYRKNEQTKAWLGTSDAVDPGANGSRAAVDSRSGALMDPRMISDGQELAETLQATLFTQLIAMNLHKFGVGSASQVPVPMMRFRTADDEVKVDAGARAQEALDVRDQAGDESAPAPVAAATPAKSEPAAPAEPVAPVAANVQATALNGAQVTSLIDLVAKVAANVLPRASAVEIAQMAFQIDAATAERVIGEAGRGFTPAAPEPAAPYQAAIPSATVTGVTITEAPPDPKAPAPGKPGHLATQATGTRYPNPFAKSRRNVSAK